MEYARYDLPEYPREPILTKFDDNLYDEKTEEEKEMIKSERQEQYEKDVKILTNRVQMFFVMTF